MISIVFCSYRLEPTSSTNRHWESTMKLSEGFLQTFIVDSLGECGAGPKVLVYTVRAYPLQVNFAKEM